MSAKRAVGRRISPLLFSGRRRRLGFFVGGKAKVERPAHGDQDRSAVSLRDWYLNRILTLDCSSGSTHACIWKPKFGTGERAKMCTREGCQRCYLRRTRRANEGIKEYLQARQGIVEEQKKWFEDYDIMQRQREIRVWPESKRSASVTWRAGFGLSTWARAKSRMESHSQCLALLGVRSNQQGARLMVCDGEGDSQVSKGWLTGPHDRLSSS